MILVNGCSFSTPSSEDNAWVGGFYENGLKPFKYGLPNTVIQHNVVKNVSAGELLILQLEEKHFGI